MLAGDTAAIKSSYADQTREPGRVLVQLAHDGRRYGGQGAVRRKDAIKLFEAARAVNPVPPRRAVQPEPPLSPRQQLHQGHRDGQQLVKVDPANPDNFQLLAIGYGSIKKGYDAKQKELRGEGQDLRPAGEHSRRSPSVVKANIDSAAKVNPLIKAYADSSKSAIDSALKYQTAMTRFPSA